MNQDDTEYESQHGRYIGTLKVGTKGQIIVPKEVRDLFQIRVGELLLLLADKRQESPYSCISKGGKQ